MSKKPVVTDDTRNIAEAPLQDAIWLVEILGLINCAVKRPTNIADTV